MKLRFMRRRGTANEGTAGTAGIDGNMMNGGAGWSLRAALGEKGFCFPLFFSYTDFNSMSGLCFFCTSIVPPAPSSNMFPGCPAPRRTRSSWGMASFTIVFSAFTLSIISFVIVAMPFADASFSSWSFTSGVISSSGSGSGEVLR